jgi:carbonic anhydrase
MEENMVATVTICQEPIHESHQDILFNVNHSSGSASEVDEDVSALLMNNRKWATNLTKKNPEYFIDRSVVHSPQWLFIGCSDARVPAELMFGLEPGELFVHRNIANQVINTDTNCASVIEYAVNALKVKHIIVCGHYGCGGKYALDSDGWGMIDHWMRSIRDVYRLHAHELDQILDLKSKLRRLVELNVAEQVVNIFKSPSFQHSVKCTGFPKVHGLVYDIATGFVSHIPIALVKDPLHRYDHVFMFSRPPVVKSPHHTFSTAPQCSRCIPPAAQKKKIEGPAGAKDGDDDKRLKKRAKHTKTAAADSNH